jgi:hypothetical protein
MKESPDNTFYSFLSWEKHRIKRERTYLNEIYLYHMPKQARGHEHWPDIGE